MKLLFGTLILGAAAAAAMGQDVTVTTPVAPMPAVPPVPAVAPRVLALPAIAGDISIVGMMRNAPFTADESGETVRILPDGNRVVENWTGKVARNSLGRMRRDITSGKVGEGATRPFIVGTTAGGLTPSVVALGAGEGNRVSVAKIEAETAVAAAGGHAVIVTSGGEAPVATTVTRADTLERQVVVEKLNAARAGELAARAAVEADGVRVVRPQALDDTKYQVRKESLGTREFGGVQAEGTRVITTIAAGAIGNDRDIEVTVETWFAKDLGVVVYSKRTDPRIGETTYQMTNIVRAEPDASLFQR